MAEVDKITGEILLSSEDKEAMGMCDHVCTSNCRREGCNCECGEFHGEDKDPDGTVDRAVDGEIETAILSETKEDTVF